jgi:hypothetical protein
MTGGISLDSAQVLDKVHRPVEDQGEVGRVHSVDNVCILPA